MRFLFDQNISFRILKELPNAFQNSTHVISEGLINAKDKEVWAFAKENEYAIVTQDSDFNELNSILGFPPKVIWIRTGNISTTGIIKILIEQEKNIEKFLNDKNYGCFEIVRLSNK